MVDQVFPPIGKDGFDPDFRIQVSFSGEVMYISKSHVPFSELCLIK